jgi:hypothetical protein
MVEVLRFLFSFCSRIPVVDLSILTYDRDWSRLSLCTRGCVNENVVV